MFPHRDTFPAHHDEPTVLAVRQDHVQGVHDNDEHQPVHQLHLSNHYECGPLYRRLPPHLVAQNSHTPHQQGELQLRILP